MGEEYKRLSKINTTLWVTEKDGEAWIWEIALSQCKDDIYGSAIERNRNAVIPWRLLIEHSLTEEVMSYCRKYMEQ